MKRKPARFQVSNQVRLERYLPPVLSGSIVSILDVRYVGAGDYRYQVQATEYQATPVWCDESDLAAPLEMPW